MSEWPLEPGAVIYKRPVDAVGPAPQEPEIGLSLAISAKRQADALVRIADALTAGDAAPRFHNMMTDLAWHMGQAFERGRVVA